MCITLVKLMVLILTLKFRMIPYYFLIIEINKS